MTIIYENKIPGLHHGTVKDIDLGFLSTVSSIDGTGRRMYAHEVRKVLSLYSYQYHFEFANKGAELPIRESALVDTVGATSSLNSAVSYFKDLCDRYHCDKDSTLVVSLVAAVQTEQFILRQGELTPLHQDMNDTFFYHCQGTADFYNLPTNERFEHQDPPVAIKNIPMPVLTLANSHQVHPVDVESAEMKLKENLHSLFDGLTPILEPTADVLASS